MIRTWKRLVEKRPQSQRGQWGHPRATQPGEECGMSLSPSGVWGYLEKDVSEKDVEVFSIGSSFCIDDIDIVHWLLVVLINYFNHVLI